MPCNTRKNQNKTPLIKFDVASTSQESTTPCKKETQTTYGYQVDVTSADHNDRALRPFSKPNLEGKPNRISKESFTDEVLHGSGLEFRRATQGREGGREGWG
jgi:hypothetical protein